MRHSSVARPNSRSFVAGVERVRGSSVGYAMARDQIRRDPSEFICRPIAMALTLTDFRHRDLIGGDHVP
jgi:hypothetical protein